MISVQIGPQTRLLQNNDTLMGEKIQSSLVNTFPLWKSQMVLALGMEHSRQATAAPVSYTHLGLPVCMAKTQYSLSDDPALPGAPRDLDVYKRQALLPMRWPISGASPRSRSAISSPLPPPPRRRARRIATPGG